MISVICFVLVMLCWTVVYQDCMCSHLHLVLPMLGVLEINRILSIGTGNSPLSMSERCDHFLNETTEVFFGLERAKFPQQKRDDCAKIISRQNVFLLYIFCCQKGISRKNNGTHQCRGRADIHVLQCVWDG